MKFLPYIKSNRNNEGENEQLSDNGSANGTNNSEFSNI